MKTINLGLCCLLLVCGMGCRTAAPIRPAPDKAYAIRAVFINAPSTLLEELGLAWMRDSSKAASTVEYEEALEKLGASRKARTTEFPVVYIDPGEHAKIDNQSPVKYPTAYTVDGKPANYMTRGVGRLIEIDLKTVTNGIAQLACHIEDVDEPVWTSYTYKIGTSSRKLKLPSFRVRSLTSDLSLPLNGWKIVGGIATTSKDGEKRNLITCIQMQATAKVPPAAAH